MRALTRYLYASSGITLVLLLCGCAGTPFNRGAPGPEVPAPTLHVGDRWVYHGVDGFRAKTEWDESHEVTAMDASGITVRVVRKGPRVDIQRTEKWQMPGTVTEGAVFETESATFDPALLRYRYPLTTGTLWTQFIRDTQRPEGNPYGVITRWVSVEGYDKISTPAGTFDAIRLNITMILDDETFWRYPTRCVYTVWYAESVGAVVQEHNHSQYTEKGGGNEAAYHPVQETEIKLVSFARG